MDGQVAKPLLYPAASENENLKFQCSVYICVSENAVRQMTYRLLNKRSSFKL